VGDVVGGERRHAFALVDGFEEQEEERQLVGGPDHAGHQVDGHEPGECRRSEPQGRQWRDPEGRGREQRARPVPSCDPAEERQGGDLGDVGRGHEQHVARIREAQLEDHVRREVGPGDLHRESGREGEAQQSRVPAPRQPAQQVHEPDVATGDGQVGLPRQAPGRVGAAAGGHQEEHGERQERRHRRLPNVQHRAAGQQPEEHRDVRRAGALGPEAGPQALRNETAHPAVPRRAGRHPRTPGRGRERIDGGVRKRPACRRDREQQVARCLGRRACHDPAAMRARSADTPGGGELQERAGQERQAGHEPAAHGAHPERQSERRDVGLAGSDHDAESDSVATNGVEVVTQTLGRPTSRRVPFHAFGSLGDGGLQAPLVR